MGMFFLWPMLIPIIIPMLYCWKYSGENLEKLWPISLSMLLIVLFYVPLSDVLQIPHIGYILLKFIVFVFMPLAILYRANKKRDLAHTLADFGVRKRGAEESITLSLFLIPAMLVTIAIVSFLLGRSYNPAEPLQSIISFFESFTEEFFFRGILFLYLWKLTDIRIAYITSIASFVLMHPQYFWDLGMVTAIVQGILTTIIVHRSKNLAGAWVLHGVSRVFALSFLPWFL